MDVKPETISPTTLVELGEAMAMVSSQGRSMVAYGGGSKANWGGPVRGADVVIDTKGLVDLDHAKEDQTIVVGAGKNFSELQAELAKAGQRVSLDPCDLDETATIGGIVATADCGPLRFRFGSPRELIIGARVALVDGVIAHSGGKVIKNVAGYDMAKLSTGSYGTLGVIGEIAFRLHPLPETQLTLTTQVNPDNASRITAALMASVVEPAAIEYGLGTLAILFEGSSAATNSQANKATSMVRSEAPGASVEVIKERSDAAIWDALVNARSRGYLLSTRVASRISHLGEIHNVANELSGDIQVVAISHAASGVHDLVIRADLAYREDLMHSLQSVLSQLRKSIGHLSQPLMIRSAAEEFSELVDLIGTPAPSSVSVMHKVKYAFDPNGLLAPGRFRPWW